MTVRWQADLFNTPMLFRLQTASILVTWLNIDLGFSGLAISGWTISIEAGITFIGRFYSHILLFTFSVRIWTIVHTTSKNNCDLGSDHRWVYVWVYVYRSWWSHDASHKRWYNLSGSLAAVLILLTLFLAAATDKIPIVPALRNTVPHVNVGSKSLSLWIHVLGRSFYIFGTIPRMICSGEHNFLPE